MVNKEACQAFYDKTVEHLFQQGFQSVNSDGYCLYRGGGLDKSGMCAIGVHIPDSLYDTKMEGQSVARFVREWPEIAPLIPSINLAMALQHVHDNVVSWCRSAGLTEDYGKSDLADIAVNFDLTPHPLLTS